MVECYILALAARKKYLRIANARIVQDEGASLEAIESLKGAKTIKTINSVLQDNPSLISDSYKGIWQEVFGVLCDENNRYIPITTSKIEDYWA